MNQRKFTEKWEKTVYENYNSTRKRAPLFFPFKEAFARAGIKVNH